MANCLVCKSEYQPFISFGNQPIANYFLQEKDFGTEYFFEMKVGHCEKCQMVQLVDQPAPEQMFHENYAFFSSTSEYMKVHFKDFALSIKDTYLKANDPFVVEMGSNDGIMLQNFKNLGYRHLGVEPSKNVAEVAMGKGINTINSFFNEETAEKIIAQYGKADAFLAANVMCHIPFIHSIAKGVKNLLSDKGVLAFEDPYLGDIVQKTSYDQIYDEHVFFFSVNSVNNAFKMHGLEVIDCLPQKTHGGSMRYILSHVGAYPISENVKRQLRIEEDLQLSNPATYIKFKADVENSRNELVNLLKKIKAEGKRVVGYGATSKSTTVLNYCGIGPELIEFISDTTPIKQGKFTPGTHIPVKAYENFKAKYPEYTLLFAWNHREEIMAKESTYTKDLNGKWITYVPEVHVF